MSFRLADDSSMATTHATPEQAVTSPGRRTATILLVDGDRAYLEVTASELERGGNAVLRATNSGAGFEIARRQQPDIIFVDVMLPGGDGLELLRRLKGDPATTDIPVVVVSGRCERHLIDECRRLGAIDFLVKGMSVTATQGYAVQVFGLPRVGGA
jgi:twitching motility two-component system response regulator PilH